MNKLFIPFIFSIVLTLINTKVIPTKDLQTALTQARPGDIIEIESGYYSDSKFTLKSGLQLKPIIIRPAPKANVIFSGTKNNCIFSGVGVSYITIEGPMELIDGYCGIIIRKGNYINITGLTIQDVQDEGIAISGNNNHIYNNTINNCAMSNSHYPTEKFSGWPSCLSVFSAGYDFSTNIIVEKNFIYNGYGEGIDLYECDNCKVIKNTVKNTYNISIYIRASKNIVLDSNTIRINSDRYNSYYGRACGIGLTPKTGRNYIENILISNNIILGTRIGIIFLALDYYGGYDKISILHNTLWAVSYAPVIFKSPYNDPTECEMKNNFIYVDGIKEFEYNNLWSFGYNYYYNTYKVPSIYSDNTSKAAKKLDISTIFNVIKGCEINDYLNNENIDEKCFHPSKTPGSFNLYHGGVNTKVNNDHSSCKRSSYSPSIGAYEYPYDCSEEPSNTDITYIEYDVKFKINACVSGTNTVKMVSSFCNWDIISCNTMHDEGNCLWSITYKEGTAYNFSYRFVIVDGNTAIKWESEPNREFNGYDLAVLADESQSGKYQSCSFSKSGTLVTLHCSWR